MNINNNFISYSYPISFPKVLEVTLKKNKICKFKMIVARYGGGGEMSTQECLWWSSTFRKGGLYAPRSHGKEEDKVNTVLKRKTKQLLRRSTAFPDAEFYRNSSHGASIRGRPSDV